MAGPLQGIRIIEMGQLIAIPSAMKWLADMGAEVIRLESVQRLESYRTDSLYHNDVTGDFWNRGANFYEQNRNKLGLTLDLSREEGRAVLRETHRHCRCVRRKLHAPGHPQFRPGVRRPAPDPPRHHYGVLHRLRVHRPLGQLRRHRPPLPRAPPAWPI